MATVVQTVYPKDGVQGSSNYATYKSVVGTNFPVEYLAFDASTEETIYFHFHAHRYGSGNLTIKVRWVADTASSGGVVFGASLAAITPDTDSQDVETKSFASEVTGSDTHLGTTGQREHLLSITLNQLDSVAADDSCVLKIARKTGNASDDMTGDCLVRSITIEYSDT